MPRKQLTHRERLALICAALGGLVSGAARAVAAWLLDRLQP
ncbi:hypothetical protein [Streptomyces sp. HP-A2021]|jgi:hypothetical protein|nr:hypothetical protein [Streptomyces sp. HP-A2021]